MRHDMEMVAGLGGKFIAALLSRVTSTGSYTVAGVFRTLSGDTGFRG